MHSFANTYMFCFVFLTKRKLQVTVNINLYLEIFTHQCKYQLINLHCLISNIFNTLSDVIALNYLCGFSLEAHCDTEIVIIVEHYEEFYFIKEYIILLNFYLFIFFLAEII